MKETPRLTPYELVFTEGDFEAETFPQIRAETGDGEIETLRRDRFDFIRTAGKVVREVTPADAPPDALEQYRAILFHAFHFWAAGRQLYVLESAAARYLVEAAPPLTEWEFEIPSRSLYLQLPANLFWSSISPDTPPEPVDGFFVTCTTGIDPIGEPYNHLDVLVVLGIRRGRAGFSVIPVTTEIGSGIPDPWGAEERTDGDFKNVLPGGELSGLYSILTTGEVLKLVGRSLWYIGSFADSLVAVDAPEPREDQREPPPSHLDHVRVTLAADSRDGT